MYSIKMGFYIGRYACKHIFPTLITVKLWHMKLLETKQIRTIPCVYVEHYY